MTSPLLKTAVNLVVIAVLLALTGCAAPPPPQMEYSGFLKDYSALEPGARGGEVYIRPGADFSRYDKVLIDPVVLFLTPETQGEISADLKGQLAEDFHDALESALKKDYRIVGQPGPDVLRVRTAITDLSARRSVGISSHARGTGISLAQPGEQPGLNIAVGSTTMEMEITDAESAERLAAAIDRKGGAVGPEGATRSDVKAVFDYWAQKVRDRLNDLRKKSR